MSRFTLVHDLHLVSCHMSFGLFAYMPIQLAVTAGTLRVLIISARWGIGMGSVPAGGRDTPAHSWRFCARN